LYRSFFLFEKIIHQKKEKKTGKKKSRYAVSRYAVTPLPVTPLRVLLTTVFLYFPKCEIIKGFLITSLVIFFLPKLSICRGLFPSQDTLYNTKHYSVLKRAFQTSELKVTDRNQSFASKNNKVIFTRSLYAKSHTSITPSEHQHKLLT